MDQSSYSSYDHCSILKTILRFFGRVAIATIFILAGIGKFLHPDAKSIYMASKGMIMIPFFLYSVAILEILGGLSLLIGYKTRWGALILMLFLIAATVIFHDFWNQGPVEAEMQKIHFLKNLAILGGLLYVMACGAGRWSIDRFLYNKELPPVQNSLFNLNLIHNRH